MTISLPITGFNSRAIEDALHTWLASTTGCGEDRTWWANQDITEVLYPFAVLNWIAEVPLGIPANYGETLIEDSQMTGHDDARADVRQWSGQALEVTISVSVFADARAAPEGTALRRLSTAIQRLNLGHREIIASTGLKIVSIGGITKPSPNQAICDLRCLVASNVYQDINSIQIINITPTCAQDVLMLHNIHFIKPSAITAGDLFGGRWNKTISASGDFFVVAANLEDSSTTGVGSTPNESASGSGAVYVFRRENGTWVEDAYIKAHNTGASDQFGASVKLLGTTLIVGAWSEDTLGTGANPPENNSGSNASAVYVFERIGGQWIQTAFLKPIVTDVNSNFGISVDYDGKHLIVGAIGSSNNASNGGAAHIYERVGNNWVPRQRINAPIVDVYDVNGFEVLIKDDIALMYSAGDDSINSNPLDNSGTNSANLNLINKNEFDRGAVHCFRKINGIWSYSQYLKADNHGPVEAFGISMKMVGNILFVGAAGMNFPNDSGCVYVFELVSNSFVQRGIIRPKIQSLGDLFGHSLDANTDASLLLVGAPYEDSSSSFSFIQTNKIRANNSLSASGCAYLFKRTSSTSFEWEEIAFIKSPNPSASDTFGGCVSMTEDYFVIGAGSEDSSTTGINSAFDELASSAGAAYVYHYKLDKKEKTSILVVNPVFGSMNYETSNQYDCALTYEGAI
jgi:hypothetical protein